MAVLKWIRVAGVGLLAGLVASLAMVLAMVAGRTWLGISPPPEAIPDRFARRSTSTPSLACSAGSAGTTG
jgi:hypothetical protein